jgi:predicted RND superfamily exporter protein
MHRLTELALCWPRLTLVLAVVTSAVSTFSASDATPNAGAHAMIGEEHPAVLELEEFSRRFGGGYPVVIAWSCETTSDPCASVFDERSLRMAAFVGSDLSEVAHVSRVLSPAETGLLVVKGDVLQSHQFVTNGRVDAPPELVARALADPLWRGAIVSGNGKVGALVVEMDSTDINDQSAVIEAVEEAISPYEDDGFNFSLSGYPWFHVASYRGVAADGLLIGAATMAVLAVSFLLLLGSWQSVLGVLATIGLATGCSLSVVSLGDWSWDPITSAAPTLVLVLGSSDAVHFLASYWRQRADGARRPQALSLAARETSAPCAMTAATSIVGLISFVGTEAIAIAHFGAVAAAGIFTSFILTFTFLPALLLTLPDTPRIALRETNRWDGLISRFVEVPIRNRKKVVLIAAMGTIVGMFGLTHLTTDAHALNYWKSDDPTRLGIEYVSSRLSSIETVEISIEMPAPLEDLAALEPLEVLHKGLERLPRVREVRSVVRIAGTTAASLGFEHLSERNLGEVLTVVSLGGGSVLDPWMSIDHRNLRVSVVADPIGVEHRFDLLRSIHEVASGMPADWQFVITGPSALQQAIDGVVERSALQSVSASSLLVTLLIIAFLRSWRWGLLGMIPNLVPMIVLFGTMGFCGIALDGGAAVVAPIAIGIAVDDTIHFLHAYSTERRSGRSSVEAARQSARKVGRAMVTTSSTLAIGFLAMLVSRFQSGANIGLLSAAAIVAAFGAELFVLPALISIFSREPAENRLAERVRSRS